jgi:hypothetical protein
MQVQRDSNLLSLATILIALVVAATLASSARAQDSGATRPSAVRFDTSTIEVALPPPGAIERYRDDDAFDYGSIYRETESPFARILRAIREWFADRLDSTSSTFWDVVGYVIVGLSLAFVVFKLIGANPRTLFFRTRKGMPIALEGDEDVHTIDYASRIAAALGDGDYRGAIRLHFLRLLRDLSESGAIKWRQWKTDLDYRRELADTPLASRFDSAANFFEYVWYGDFPIDLAGYERMSVIIDSVARAREAAS